MMRTACFISSIHNGFVGKPAATCRYCTSSSCDLSLQMLWMALLGVGQSGSNWVNGFLTSIVSVLPLRTMGGVECATD